MSDLDTRFEAAAEKARGIQGVSNENKGNLYGLFKQASEGPIGDLPRPGIFNMMARTKYDAWAKHGDMGKEDAQEKYITLVDSL
jgi:diazepam-binding inhibitor (GABA receptor modulating acyl-CoA-binding protein)